MARIGVLTIGQSPRLDVTPAIQQIVGNEVTIIERGGLDRITPETLHLISPEGADTTYISKLRNGQAVKIGKTKLLPLLQEELTALENEVDIVLMLCTGDFPTLKTRKPILYPDRILTHTLRSILPEGEKIGLIIPLEEQREALSVKWDQSGFELEIEVASPYEESDPYAAGASLKKRGVSLIVLDCMGYQAEHKMKAKQGSGLPVILSSSLVARLAQEYVT
ncbi:AroM family protein [Bacillus horti]|uniref:Protein AroM n=1 Tax=Caldalkalibacillus horti TaxID=77523 RepID=A0ABT9W3W6_9BACI|nr:AroM family protein [Bacillus horti]MDQ0167922.1 protein AroM [Bacillus horti]